MCRISPQTHFRGANSPAGFRISPNRIFWLVLWLTNAKAPERKSYLLKSITADSLGCTAAVTPPVAALGEADVCEITCRDQTDVETQRTYDMQPPTGVEVQKLGLIFMSGPPRLPAWDQGSSSDQMFLVRGLLSWDVTLDLGCNRLYRTWNICYASHL